MSSFLLALIALFCFGAGAYQFILCIFYKTEMTGKEYFWRNIEGWAFMLCGFGLLHLIPV